MKRRYTIIASILCAICLVACSSHPENKLLGKWQSNPIPDGKAQTKQLAFEFLEDGTVVYRIKWQTKGTADGQWKTQATGMFHLINPTHVKMDWGLAEQLVGAGSRVFEVDWRDSDHIVLKDGDGGKTAFERIEN
jgi:hypothetical protein